MRNIGNVRRGGLGTPGYAGNQTARWQKELESAVFKKIYLETAWAWVHSAGRCGRIEVDLCTLARWQ
jgi:hypothetical protein